MNRHGAEWPPDFRVPSYQGPYPRWELEAARRELIEMLATSSFSLTIERLKPRLGISSTFGQGQSPPPVPKSAQDLLNTSGQSHQAQNEERYNVSSAPNVTQSRYSQVQPQTGVTPLMHLSENFFHQYQKSPAQYSDSPVASTSRNAPLPLFHSTPTKSVMQLNQPPSSLFNIETRPFSDSGYCGGDSVFDTPPVDGQENGRRGPYTRNTPAKGLSSGPSNPPVLSLKHKSESRWDSPWNKRARTGDDSETLGAQNSVPLDNTMSLLHKCDFCQFTAKSVYQMENHLTSSKHFSGSLYNAVSNAEGHKLVSVEKMLAVKNQYSMTKALIVACPDCQEIFEDIFMCALHHKYKHGSVTGLYAICPIIQHHTLSVFAKPVCGKCPLTFPKHKDLHQHWRKTMSHYPVQEPANPKAFAIYICPYCSVIFYNNFLACKSHVLGHQRSSETFAVEVKHVMMSNSTHEMLPFNTSGQHKDGLQLELDILANMQKFYKHGISGAKGKAHAIVQQMAMLKEMIQSQINA